ncbi:MAG: septal ring lytic transglycosylase RlpA family protein [Spiribacter sp.]|nr:septal ring lytic transglycosylase RlpA family protein [Spiribacter sp.]MDR9489528.1 septal ring lytic transglycosylase RlpA family protein [Spiribacter sp.]
MRSTPGFLLALLLLLAGCSGMVPEPGDGPGSRIDDPMAIPDAIPKDVPKSRYGNPESYEVFGQRYEVMESASGHRERGIASWYGSKFHGRRTSSGEPYDMYAMTAAHKHLPLPVWVEVRHLGNDRRIVVKVNDRGPFADNRIIDLSYAAAAKLGMLGTGTAPVEIRTLTPGETPSKQASVTTASTPPEPTSSALKKPAYWIQVAAFGSADNAKRMQRDLASAALSIPVQITRGQDGLHRVRLGPLTDVAAVDQATDELRRANFQPGHVIIANNTGITD